MREKSRLLFGTLIVFLLAFSFIPGCLDKEADEEEEEEDDQHLPIPENLIDPADLVYLGAFRLPESSGTGPEGNTWSWGGSSMTYYPGGDPEGPDDGYPGSIFGTGLDQYQYVSEISIPAPVISTGKDLTELNTAGTLQDFVDIRQGLFGELELPRVGLEYLPKQGGQSEDKLYFTWGQHMQELESGPSHGWFDLDLSDPDRAGPWSLEGQIKYNITDYIFEIPSNWAAENTPGYRLATGRFRDGGQGTLGPSLIAYGPWNQGDPPAKNSALPNTPLIMYSSVYDDPGAERALNGYHHSDEWSGGSWLTTEDKAAVIFVGMKGQGDCWYGFQDGTVWPEEPPFPPEGPGERGWWSDSWIAQIIFYDPDDLAAVASGQMEPYEPQPYATLNINDLLWNRPTDEIRPFGAVSFDRERGMLYAFEFRGDPETDNPLVHVWRVA
ncbi:MAG: hypothetical protein ACMUHU_06275 [Thermoplasmatota archaeon]